MCGDILVWNYKPVLAYLNYVGEQGYCIDKSKTIRSEEIQAVAQSNHGTQAVTRVRDRDIVTLLWELLLYQGCEVQHRDQDVPQ